MASRIPDGVRRWLILVLAYLVAASITLYLGRFVDAPWDLALLLALNPDSYIPVVDEFMIFLTDFSVYSFAFLFIFWVVAYYICRGKASRKRGANIVFRIFAVVLGLWHLSGVFFGFVGITYEYNLIFIPLALVFFVGFWFAGMSFVALDDETLAKIATVFWLTLVAAIFTNLLGTTPIKEYIGRFRPLNDAYSPWNEGLRAFTDETVRGGFSYISGHSSSLFALLTPLFWAVKNRWVKGGLMVWATLHAFTRVYVAVHFPYCCIIGSLYGFIIGTCVFHSLGKYEDRI